MRKAAIDSKTQRAIMGHKTGSVDDRYTVIDDEAFEDAIDKINAYQKRQGMISELKELAAGMESKNGRRISQKNWKRLKC
jgi:hypothetical protein